MPIEWTYKVEVFHYNVIKYSIVLLISILIQMVLWYTINKYYLAMENLFGIGIIIIMFMMGFFSIICVIMILKNSTEFDNRNYENILLPINMSVDEASKLVENSIVTAGESFEKEGDIDKPYRGSAIIMYLVKDRYMDGIIDMGFLGKYPGKLFVKLLIISETNFIKKGYVISISPKGYDYRPKTLIKCNIEKRITSLPVEDRDKSHTPGSNTFDDNSGVVTSDAPTSYIPR